MRELDRRVSCCSALPKSGKSAGKSFKSGTSCGRSALIPSEGTSEDIFNEKKNSAEIDLYLRYF
jgi:hypothetical protein